MPSGPTASPTRATSCPTAGDDPRRADPVAGPVGMAGALDRLAGLSAQFGAEDLAGEARAALQPLQEGILRVVALGQFKRGKSTLLNALLGAPLLPMGVAPVTSVTTLVGWAPEPRLRVVFADGRVEDFGIHRLPDFVIEDRNPGNALDVARIEVGYPARLLADGLVLVDTPGVGSTDRGATERAYGFLPSVDAGLVVLSPDPPLGEAEADYVRTLASLTPHLLFVLNKIDRVAEAEWREAMNFNRRILGALLGTAPEDVDFLPVSARRALEDGDGSVAALERTLLRFVAERGSAVRDGLASRRLGEVSARLRGRIGMERRAMDLEEGELDRRIELLRGARASLNRQAERAAATVMTAVEGIVVRAGEALLTRARDQAPSLASALRDMAASAPSTESNVVLASRFDAMLEELATRALDDGWRELGPTATDAVLEEMTEAARSAADARGEASGWILGAFGIPLPAEPQVEVLRESVGFYRSVHGVAPRITLDMVRFVLPRGIFRAWLRRRAGPLATQALEMGAGQVQGDLLYRARETVRGFLAELRAWTLAGVDGLVDAAGRAAALRLETGRSTEARRSELDRALEELDALEDRSWASRR